jgi:L-alanine-DL-glutamate epimerase-like enolase superfamily enzyme
MNANALLPRLTFASARLERLASGAGTVHVLELTASDGTTGSAPLRLSEDTHHAIRRFGPKLLGRPVFAAAERWSQFAALLGPHALGPNWAAFSAIENASADLCARALGVPLYELLGGHARRRIAVAMSLTCRHGNIEPLIARARHLLSLGVEAILVRTTRLDWRAAVLCLGALREAFGPDLRLRLAFLRPLSPDDHEYCLRAVAPLGLEYIQDATVQLRPSDAPRCTRRAIRDWDCVADVLRSPAFPAFSLSVLGWGGVAGITRLAVAARVFHRDIVLSSDVVDGQEAALSAQIALALPAISMGIELPIGHDDATFSSMCHGIPMPTDPAPSVSVMDLEMASGQPRE